MYIASDRFTFLNQLHLPERYLKAFFALFRGKFNFLAKLTNSPFRDCKNITCGKKISEMGSTVQEISQFQNKAF